MNISPHVQRYLFLSAACFVIGIIFCAFYNQWLIIKLPSQQPINTISTLVNKKTVILDYFHHDKWKTETQEHLWTESDAKNLIQLINAWLTLLDEEHITPKKTTVQSVLISPSSTAYISFDHNILSKEDSIFKKWMVIESLLKTIRSNTIVIQNVQFLMHHQILNDAHLDFSSPWPLNGFMQ